MASRWRIEHERMSALLELPVLDQRRADDLLALLGEQAQLVRVSQAGPQVGIVWVGNAAIDADAAREFVVNLLDALDPSWRTALQLPTATGRHPLRDGNLSTVRVPGAGCRSHLGRTRSSSPSSRLDDATRPA